MAIFRTPFLVPLTNFWITESSNIRIGDVLKKMAITGFPARLDLN